jgi:hypothetical protein
MLTRKSSTKGPRNKTKVKRVRDFRAEYARRVQRGILKGLSRSQARGHTRAGERLKPHRPILVNPRSKEEHAIRAMKGGLSLREVARAFGLSEQHLRRYAKENAGAVRVGRQWVFEDQRVRQFPIYSEGELKTVLLKPYEASVSGSFMHAVRRFLWSGDRQILAPYEGQGVTDVNGRFHRLETDPNRLYELDSAGELNFPEFYRIIN